MKFTLSWLKDHIDTTASLDEISHRLSGIGLEVEGVVDAAAALAPFTIARVVEAKQHPNADRLRVLQVEIAPGKPTMEVVCGAPNAKAGMIGVFAALGTYIPGLKVTLDKKPVRGIISNGMMVSERELELSDAHEGIIELDGKKYAGDVGKRYVDVIGDNDPVIEVKLTPNRPDCTGVRGIARDLAAAGLGKLKPEPKLAVVEGTFDCPVDIKLDFASPETATACPVFAGRYVRGVKNGPAPAWMQARLKAVGLRPISALVDVTNYVSLDRGRPLHVYDADKVKGAIRARLGIAGEKFEALDGKTYMADGTMCVIADDSGPLGLGGIIGGASTGCSETTTNVLIECAYFDPVRIATSGRKAGVQTDARYRFERGVDPAFVEGGLDLATDLIMQVAGGTPSKRKIAGKPPVGTREIAFDFARIEKLTGLAVPEADSRRILEALGFTFKAAGKTHTVTSPSWRPDVHGAADLVEEVVRIVGLENVPSVPMPRLTTGVTASVLTAQQRRARRMRRLLAGRGFVEAVTWSFIPKAQAVHFGGGADALDLDNPISVELSTMRPSLLPGLLTAAQRNRNRGFADVALFELGQAYKGDQPKDQILVASGVRTGSGVIAGSGRHWSGRNADPTTLFDVKADVVAALASLGFDGSKAQISREAPAWFHPGKSAALKLGPKVVLAYFGELHPDTLKMLDCSGGASAFEIFLDAIPAEKKKSRARSAFAAAELLPVRRDFAFVVDETVAAGDLIKAARGADKALITDVSVFDVFAAASLGAGKKSVALEVTLQPTEKALVDAEIEAISKKIAADVKAATGGELRG
jgi:phenylalanyl-tRNA synthetase beta chain